jgi:plasmid stability protein
MPTLTIKNVPDELYLELRKMAAEERRSLNGEVIHLLEHAVRGRRPDPGAVRQRAASLRARTKGVWVTQADLDSFKAEGRP